MNTELQIKLRTTLGPEQYLIYVCVLDYLDLLDNVESVKDLLSDLQINYNVMIETAMDCGLWPIMSVFVDRVIKQNIPDNEFPLGSLREASATGRRDNAIQISRVRKQILNISEILNRNSVNNVFLKGAASLVDNLWKHPSDRFLSDIDILVPPSEIELTTRLLQEIGYRQSHDDKDLSDHHHIAPLISNEVHSLPVEIHHLIGPERFQRELNTNDIFSKKMAIQMQGETIFIPSLFHRHKHAHLHSSFYLGNKEKRLLQLRDHVEVYLLAQKLEKHERQLKTTDLITYTFDQWQSCLFGFGISENKRSVYGRKFALLTMRLLQDQKSVAKGQKKYNYWRTLFLILNDPLVELPRRFRSSGKKQ